MRVGVAHPGPQHSAQTALALQEASRLGWYATSFYYKASAWPDRAAAWLPTGLRRRAEAGLLRRRLDGLEDGLVRRQLGTELVERAAARFLSGEARIRLQYRREWRFPARVVRLFEQEPVDLLWAPVACLGAFRAMKARGGLCVLDHASGHPVARDRIAREEYARHAEFFRAEPPWITPAELELHREAAHLADLVVVGSAFAAGTFIEAGVDPAKLRVIPYGYDERLFSGPPPMRPPVAGRPTEFVYLGRISAMKGAAYLLEAFRRIDPARARLTLIGALEMPPATFARYADRVAYVGPVPHVEVAARLARADCFVFPSLFEGGGIALYEAAACGLGVIQSDACGDGVRGGNGLVIPAGSADAIAAAVEAAMADGAILHWSEAARALHAERSWARYRAAVAATIGELERGR